jgi:hypothetical protein
MSFNKYLKRFIFLPLLEKKLIIKYGSFSYFIQICFLLLPSKLFFKLFIKNINSNAFTESQDIHFTTDAYRTLKRITIISPYLKNCLIKALVFKSILNYYNIKSTLILSMYRQAPNRLIAHAWLKVNNDISYFRQPNFVDIYK